MNIVLSYSLFPTIIMNIIQTIKQKLSVQSHKHSIHKKQNKPLLPYTTLTLYTQVVLSIIGTFIVGLPLLVTFPYPLFIGLSIGLLPMIIMYMYVAGFMLPVIHYNTVNNNTHNKTIPMKKARIFAILGGFSFTGILLFDSVLQNLFKIDLFINISTVCLFLGIFTHGFVCKAQAGKLPQWVYRWLERHNPYENILDEDTPMLEDTTDNQSESESESDLLHKQ